jgi:1-acyl-sn-glycerol-3-phosphate acyltransferase
VTAATGVRMLTTRGNALARARMTQDWGRALCAVCGIRVERVGSPPREPALLVANHRSYADIGALASCAPMTFIAKVEIRDWPVLGTAAERAGTVFVRRGDRRSGASALRQARQLLAHGISIAVFPEGTTVAAPGIGRFELGAFRLAAAARFPIVPVAIEYTRANDAWTDPDDRTFLPHFLTTFGRRHVDVRIAFGTPLVSRDAEQLCADAAGWINAHVMQEANALSL